MSQWSRPCPFCVVAREARRAAEKNEARPRGVLARTSACILIQDKGHDPDIEAEHLLVIPSHHETMPPWLIHKQHLSWMLEAALHMLQLVSLQLNENARKAILGNDVILGFHRHRSMEHLHLHVGIGVIQCHRYRWRNNFIHIRQLGVSRPYTFLRYGRCACGECHPMWLQRNWFCPWADSGSMDSFTQLL